MQRNFPSYLPQIDVPNDIQQKTLRAVQKYLAGKDSNATIFDEAQYCVFKELLPYWAGFMRNYKEPPDKTKVPCECRPLVLLELLKFTNHSLQPAVISDVQSQKSRFMFASNYNVYQEAVVTDY